MKRDLFEEAVVLLREAPLSLPSPSRREEVRTAVLVASRPLARLALPEPPRPRRHRMYGAALVAVVAAAAALGFVLREEPAPSPHVHATITARDDARYTALATAPDEVIRLEHGTIDVDVAPLHPGERFRVVVGDAEVEVRGTSFEVHAADDRLVSVHVHHGRVEVRPRDRNPQLLGAGERWHAAPAKPVVIPVEPLLLIEPAPTPPQRKSKPRPASPSPTIEAPPPPPPPPPQAQAARSPDELAYDDAWTAMRAGNYTRAATSFARVMIIAPDGGLVEDATFWQAVALARGGRRSQAATALRDFLDAHPRSPHTGEASAMLGWMLVDSGERAEAARRFRAAIDDPSKSVRESARSGLETLGQ